ncbi:hypothetical protein [Pseudonocardia nigra]|uniref:hypothetical protein n=1 Tax=Pseudonocardia nigra TaxID=1921578 RepID=UPI001C5E676E|nr:hypothetical protein [Pseudonocardia nigra]
MDEPAGARVTLTPGGAYAEIDVAGQNAAVGALLGPDEAGRARAVTAVLEAPGRFAPPVLYALSEVLSVYGERDEGAFWFYAAQLRARFDANRCTDPTAAAAVGSLNERFGPPVKAHAFRDPDLLRALVERAVAWDRATPHDYDHRWINLHGMAAFGGPAGEPLSLPAPEWAALAERTRRDYRAGLEEALRRLAAGPA